MTALRVALALVLVGLVPPVAMAQGKSAAELQAENAKLRKLNATLTTQMAKLRKAKQKTINHLRRQVTRAEDDLLDLARRFDTEKKRLQDEKETVLKEMVKTHRNHALQVARLETELAQLRAKLKGGPQADPLARPVTVNFAGTPLREALTFLTDVTRIHHRLAQADAKLGSVKVNLRLKNITLRNALGLIAASHRGLNWRRVGKQIVFSTRSQLVFSPSGLGSHDLVVGRGAEAVRGKLVSVHYVGKLKDGTVFDNSRTKGKPLQFVIGQRKVIAGWEEGVQGMKTGGKRELLIPPGLAYGKRGFPGKVPPNATLTFEIELLKVE